jgi:hypothetical protein
VHMEYEDAATSPALDFLPLDFNDRRIYCGTVVQVRGVCCTAVV